MNSEFYLPRTLFCDNSYFSEAAVLNHSKFIVVLAEPGGGKTSLLESLAAQLEIKLVTANFFMHKKLDSFNAPFVIDAFDELAKLGSSGIHSLLAKLSDFSPSAVILSSRSSEWDDAFTRCFADFFDIEPLIVRMVPFDDAEQRLIFGNHTGGNNFNEFKNEIARFDLAPLLPNPQFLKLFADAYFESGRQFNDKTSIFELAIERLAKEVNRAVLSKDALTFSRKIELAEEVFAKLLLSGSEGVSTSDISSERLYPHLKSLIVVNSQVEGILATRLFKPGDKADQHTPVHKIVSEYCAAKFLVKELSSDIKPLSLSQSLSIIAPNSIVRDELRGLIGWMAALGNKLTQEALIDLDPYAVLANGNPSQLEPSSKQKLLRKLRIVANDDPYFRRGDMWRTFSAAGFFTNDVLDELKALLITDDEFGHLRGLLLELLTGSKVVVLLTDELQKLAFSNEMDAETRSQSFNRLLEVDNLDHKSHVFKLIEEASETSLSMAAAAIEHFYYEYFGNSFVAKFLRSCADLYPTEEHLVSGRFSGGRFFINRFITKLNLDNVTWLLNELTSSLTCKCGKESYECICRIGLSKIVGNLLDRYFELAAAPYQPIVVWNWLKNLFFKNAIDGKQSLSVKVLQKDDVLRQEIIRLVFENEKDSERIHTIKTHQFDWLSHSGLSFQAKDNWFIVDLAFEADNTSLWSYFMARHQHHRNVADRGPNALRRHMKLQARQKLAFLRVWTNNNRSDKRLVNEHKLRWGRSSLKVKKAQKRRELIRKANIKYVQDNRNLVETGKHWSILKDFAWLTLSHPEKIKQEYGDDWLVRTALLNCIEFMESKVPSLSELAEFRCSSKFSNSLMIVYASCLEIYRTKGSLIEVPPKILEALKTDTRSRYQLVDEQERDAINKELNRLLFPDAVSAEKFLRAYVEPQLASPDCKSPQVELLIYDEVFKQFQATFAIEWLDKFDNTSLVVMNQLFELAGICGQTNELKAVISKRCKELFVLWPSKTCDDELEKKRIFWLIREFYFFPEINIKYWEWLKSDKNTVLMLNARSGRLNRSENMHWPMLTSIKIEAILDAFIGEWPAVDLPSHWGSESPPGEKAYRFLTEMLWLFENDEPDDAIPVIERLLLDSRLSAFHSDLKSIRASHLRKKTLRDFEAPTAEKIVAFFNQKEIATVESFRALLLDEFKIYQADLNGSETTSKDVFYTDFRSGMRLGEVAATLRIADRMRLLLERKGITVTPEHQLKDANRCDFTCTKILDNKRKLLVIEVKGQWHADLYSSASKQLYERYTNHPDAEHQGIYLILWFGEKEKIAGIKNHNIKCAQELKEKIRASMPKSLLGLIDVFVLDVSKHSQI